MKRCLKKQFSTKIDNFSQKGLSSTSETLRLTFTMIKKITQEGDFEFCIPTPNLTKILNPQEFCADNF